MPHTFGNEPPREPPLRWPLLVMLVVVLLAAVVAVILSDVSTQADAALSQPVASRGFTQSLPAAARSRPGVTTPRTAPVIETSIAENAQKPGPNEVEVCGLGVVKVSDQDSSGIERIPAPVRRATEERIWTSMQASADERVRAAGWLFEARLRSVVVDTQRPGLPALDSRALDRLAQLAANTRDPLVYRLAMEGCLGQAAALQGAGGCQLINAEQWTRVDPSNAIPWLMLAATARDRKDAAAEAEAVHRASVASISNAYWGALPKIVTQALPSDLPPIGKTIAITDAWEAQTYAASALLTGVGAATVFCSSEALRDSNRGQTCERLASVLIDNGRTLIEERVAWGIRERMGWPKERVQAIRNEQWTLLDASAQHLRNAGELSCEGVTRMTQWAELTEQLGELGAAREVFRRSGKNLEQASREFQQRLAAQFASAEKDGAASAAGGTAVTATATASTAAFVSAR